MTRTFDADPADPISDTVNLIEYALAAYEKVGLEAPAAKRKEWLAALNHVLRFTYGPLGHEINDLRRRLKG